jgi:hypothetical protein
MNARRAGLRSDIVAVLSLAALITIVFADVLFLGNQFFFRDITRYYYPAKHVIRDIVLSGEFPFWNRFFSSGQPLAANPEFEVFYPPQWLIFLPRYDVGFRLHLLVHLYIGAIGMYAFARSRGRSIPASWLAAVSFAMGGYFLSLVNLAPILFVVAWMPIIFLFARRFFLRPNPRDFALASVFLGMQLLAGEPVSLLMTWMLVGFQALRHGWRNVILAVLMVFSGVAVGAVQFIPALDHVADSVRSRGLDYREVTQWSMPLARPLELVAPKLFGEPYQFGRFYWGRSLYPLRWGPFYLTIYFGLIGITFALAGVIARIRGWRAIVGVGLLSYCLAIGANGWLFHILFDLGIGQYARYPEKFILLALVPLTVFSADAFDALLQGNTTVRKASIAILAVIAFLAILLIAFAYPAWFSRIWSISRNAEALASIAKTGVMVVLAKAIILAAIVTSMPKLRRNVFVALLGVFWAADVLPMSNEYLVRMPARFFSRPPLVDALRRNIAAGRLFHEGTFWYEHGVSNPYDAIGEGSYWMVRNALQPMLPAGYGLPMAVEGDYDRTALLTTADFYSVFENVMARGPRSAADLMLAMSNVRARILYRDFQRLLPSILADPEVVTPVVVIAATANPRYDFADRLIHVSGVDDFRNKMKAGRWSMKTAFVPFSAFEPSPARVMAVSESANSARVDVESSGRALLVISVTGHKYWQAEIDQTPAVIQPVNIAYQGIVVPAGRHVLRLTYRNPRIVAGAVVSLLAVAVLIVIALIPRRRRPRIES